jgi:tRNA(Glu) U13 pseudouridine synthase TruD
MINANVVIEISQKVNREKWLEDAAAKLSAVILEVAKTGKRELKVPFKELIIGAETLYESGEMLAYLDKILKQEGFSHVVKPDGTLIVSW